MALISTPDASTSSEMITLFYTDSLNHAGTRLHINLPVYLPSYRRRFCSIPLYVFVMFSLTCKKKKNKRESIRSDGQIGAAGIYTLVSCLTGRLCGREIASHNEIN
jgi:hypothetical protein